MPTLINFGPEPQPLDPGVAPTRRLDGLVVEEPPDKVVLALRTAENGYAELTGLIGNETKPVWVNTAHVRFVQEHS